jgi:hypothetical protein
MCLLCIVWLNMHIKYICMRMFHVVALPDSGVDGRGRYNMVSEHGFNAEPGWAG